MKATWNMNDFQAMAQNDLHFSREQARELTSRYGTPRQAEDGADRSLRFAVEGRAASLLHLRHPGVSCVPGAD